MSEAIRGSRWLVMLMAVAWVAVGCAKTVYGVSEERWERMTEAERTAARQAHAERQRQLEAERAERARREAIAAEQRRREADEAARRQHEQVEAIHRGESGVYGDLIRVTISDGTMEFYGKRLPYQPVTFTLANHERRKVTFQSAGGRSSRLLEVPVSYEDGTFMFDAGRNPVRILHSPGWRSGKVYSSLTLGKHSVSDGQDLRARIEIVPQASVVAIPPPGGSRDDSRGRPHHPLTPTPPPAPRRTVAVKNVQTQGLFPHDLRLKHYGKNCINLSPFEEHNRAVTGLKSFVIERDGYAVLLEILELRKSDPSRKRTICRADRSQCRETSGWMFLKVNGTGMFLQQLEVKRLSFDNGATLLISAVEIHERHEREGSGVCWN